MSQMTFDLVYAAIGEIYRFLEMVQVLVRVFYSKLAFFRFFLNGINQNETHEIQPSSIH